MNNKVRYQRSSEAIHSEIEGEVVALNIERGQCFGMNQPASAIWRLLDQPRDLANLCAQLVEAYDVDRATCEADLTPLLETMLQDGLVEALPPG